jgi:hypothetical protein
MLDFCMQSSPIFTVFSILRLYSPALVVKCRVQDGFCESNTHYYSGAAAPKPPLKAQGSNMLHAMLLIGIRDEEGKRWFLLQNWWEPCQFVEVDAEYLKSCKPRILFIKTPQTKIEFGCLAKPWVYGEAASRKN